METRARKIVKLAAKQSKAAKQWLLLDEFGGHERHAAQLLEATAQRAADMGLTEAQVDGQIALAVAMSACQAMLNVARRGQ